MNISTIKKILNIVLSEPPAAIGMRLSSERKLAKLFEENQHNIRKILDKFVTDGILSRRHGSGTFIIKVKSFKRYKDQSLYLEAKTLAPEILCVTPSGRKMKKHRLTLSLWSDFLDTTDIHNSIAQSICKRAQEFGHSIVMKSLIKEIGVPLDFAEIVEEIKHTPHDGNIVIARWAELFKLASSIALGGERVPTCYLMPCSYYIECEPYITLDTDDVIRRAIRIFAKSGYDKIGILQLHEQNFSQFKQSANVFKLEMELFGLHPFMQDIPYAEYGIEDVRTAVKYFIDSEVEALYIADDHILHLLSEVFNELGIVPGRDIAVITIANRDINLPEAYNWSRFEFDLDSFGKTIVDSLLNAISTAGENMMSFSHKATWHPAETHTLYTE